LYHIAHTNALSLQFFMSLERSQFYTIARCSTVHKKGRLEVRGTFLFVLFFDELGKTEAKIEGMVLHFLKELVTEGKVMDLRFVRFFFLLVSFFFFVQVCLLDSAGYGEC